MVGEWKRGVIWYQTGKDFDEVVALNEEHLGLMVQYGFINTMATDRVISALDDRLGKSFRWFRQPQKIGVIHFLQSEVNRRGLGIGAGYFKIMNPASMDEVMDVRQRGKAPGFLRMPESGYWYETRGD